MMFASLSRRLKPSSYDEPANQEYISMPLILLSQTIRFISTPWLILLVDQKTSMLMPSFSMISPDMV
jgi:hypothetical protein